MAGKIIRNAMSWLAAPFQPPMLPLTMVLAVLFAILITDFIAIMMSDKFQ